MYLLSEGAESYHYLSQSGCVQDNSLDDKQLFDSVMVRSAGRYTFHPQRAPLSIMNIADLQSIKFNFKEM